MRFILILVFLLTLRTLTSAQTIAPTQSDAIIIDLGTPGSADPGDRIRYTVTIPNTGGAPATLVQLNAVLDSKTTLVPGSFKTSPLAINDTYTVTGNVGITINAAAGMRANDYDDNIPLLTQAVGTFATTGLGSITVAADGSFTYTPAPGFTGNDTYIYTLTDGDPVGLPVPLTDMGTVTFTVSNMIWFIDNSVAGPGTGTLADPFKTIASFNGSAAAAGNVVFLKNTGTNYTNGIVLKNNQLFFGTGTSGGSTLADVLPFSLAPNSPALPPIAGTRPIIAPSANDGILLASGNTVRGVEVGAVTGTGAKIKGTNFGTVTIGNTTTPDVALNGNGQALNLTTGTFAATSKFVSIATTSSSGQGIIFTGVAGTVAFGSTSVSGATTQGILIGTSTAVIDFGNTTVTSTTDGVSFQNNASGTKTFGTLTISGGTGIGFLHGTSGGPVTVTGATLITNPTGVGIDIQNSASPVTFAATTVNKGASAGIGVNLGGSASGNSGNTTFNSLAITTSNGAGLVGTNNTGTTTVTTNAGSISAAAGPAINFNRTGGNTPVVLNFTNVGTTSSSTNGVALTNVSGTYVVAGGTLTGCTGSAFLVSGGSVDITHGGTITGNSALAVDIDNHDSGNITFQTGNIVSTTQGIRVQNCGGGTIAFNNPSKSLNTGANTAVTLATNTGATINFGGGGLVTTTTSGSGYSATAGGTINVTGTTNTITSTTGVALNVANTTIGANNLNFLSISANGASNGIVLNTTGASGGLSVTGTGSTNGSGGTIQNITNRGVSAVSSNNLTLKNITFTNANGVDGPGPCGAADNGGCNAAIHVDGGTTVVLDNVDISGTTAEEGINLKNVTTFSLAGSTLVNCGIASSGSDTEESCLYALNLGGTCSINTSSLTFPSERAAVIYNTSKTMALTVNGSTFGMNQAMALGADGLEIDSYGASNTTIDIIGSTFVQPKTNGLQVITENTSVSDVDIQTSTFDPGPGLAAAIDLDVNNTANMKFNIINNPSIKGKGINIINVFAFPNATFEGRINNNTVINTPTSSGSGIRVFGQGNGNCKVEIKNNNVTGGADYGIDVTSQLGTGRMDATITGNTVTTPTDGFYSIHLLAGNSGSVSTNKVCGNVANNTTTTTGMAIGNFQARSSTAGHEILLQGGGTTVATNWNANTNSPLSPTAFISQSGTGVFTFGATCLLPLNPAITP